jgi:hypothetical protein
MMRSTYTLTQLIEMGWDLDPTRGINRPDLVSLALVLRVDDVRLAQVGGIGPTYEAAVADVVAEANRWLRVNGMP